MANSSPNSLPTTDTVFILGAGASREAGAPLMSDFLDIAQDLLVEGRLSNDTKHFQGVFELLAELQIVHSKSSLDLNNIESIFGAIEMSKIIGRLVSREQHEIEIALDSIRRLIVRTLEETVKFTVTNGEIQPHSSYEKFSDLVLELIERRNRRVSIITFNYDIALDIALHRSGLKINYMIPGKLHTDGVNLLKLHGSINWGRCANQECNSIVPHEIDRFLRSYQPPYSSQVVRKDHRVHISDSLAKLQHCNQQIRGSDSVLIPPTWNKSDYHGMLAKVWSEAADSLNSARYIYVMGYSLPESDAFFRYLFALGTAGKSRIQSFAVFDPDETGTIEDRYRRLIGTGLRDRFEYRPLKFSRAVDELQKALLA